MLASKNEDNFKGQSAQWTSKYGSVTFNQYGCELAHGGMNEVGLVIEAMALYDTIYPKPDSRPFVHRSQWVQSQLDNCKAVEDVINNDLKIRISPIYSGPGTHFLISDRTGNCANIEFLNGKMDVYNYIRETNKSIPILFISGNIEFLESIKELKQKDTNIDHLSKPCQNNEYVKSVNRLLERTSISQQ